MTANTAPIDIIPPVRVAHPGAGGVLLAVVGALAFSSSAPLVKPLLAAGWSLSAALFVRMLVAGLVLSPALIKAMRDDRRFLQRHWRMILAFGLLPVAGCQLLFFAAMSRMPVAVALLIQYLAPVLLVGLAWARTRRAPSRHVLAGTIVAVVGLVLVVNISGASFDLLGTLLALAAAVSLAGFYLIVERTGDDLPPLALASSGLFVGAGLMVLLAVVGISPFAVAFVSVDLMWGPTPWWVSLLWVSVIATPVGYACSVLAVPRIGSRLASFVGLSEVLFALGFAWLLLGEAPTLVQLIGGVVLLTGVALVRLDGGRAARPARLSARAARRP